MKCIKQLLIFLFLSSCSVLLAQFPGTQNLFLSRQDPRLININGAFAGDNLGRGFSAISDAGDVNGDGIPDIVIGAFSSDLGGPLSGSAYVIFGTPTLAAGAGIDLQDVENQNGNLGFLIKGSSNVEHTGHAVSAIGDMNGDGFDDLLVGAHQADYFSRGSAGRAYVVFGKASNTTIDLTGIVNQSSSDGFAIHGAELNNFAGLSVRGDIGDINGDNIPDIMIGAIISDPLGRTDAGRVYVVFGKTTNTAIDLLDINNNTGGHGFVINGASAGDEIGYGLGALRGDMNGDGINDLIVGARRADPFGTDSGAAYVVYGKSTTAPIDLADIEANNGGHGFAIYGASAGDEVGQVVSGAGDVNGDGIPDVIIGGYLADPLSRFNAGSAYVVYGKNTTTPVALVNIENNNGGLGFVINGAISYGKLGNAVSNAGDVNGDGRDDVIVGAYQANYGSAYVVFGNNSTAPIDVTDIDNNVGGLGFAIHGTNDNNAYHFGTCVSGVGGDMNNDGLDDIILSTDRSHPFGRSNAGVVVIVPGQTQTTPVYVSSN